MIIDAVTGFIGSIIEGILKPVRELLAATLLATPNVTEQEPVKRMWQSSLAAAIALYVLFIMAGGITVMGYETMQSRYALKQIAPRLLLGMVASASSLTVMDKAIQLANALSGAVMGTSTKEVGQGLAEHIFPLFLARAQLYLALFALLLLIMVCAVLFGYVVRVAVLALLAVAAPLALACHAHPLSDGVARLWWRALWGCLAIQIAQSMAFVLSLKLFFAPGNTVLDFPNPGRLGPLLAGLALFWVLFKIPGWCTQVILRGTPITPPRGGGMVRKLRQIALWQLLNTAAPGAGSLLARRGGGGGLGRLGGGGARRPGPPGGGPRPRGPSGGPRRGSPAGPGGRRPPRPGPGGPPSAPGARPGLAGPGPGPAATTGTPTSPAPTSPAPPPARPAQGGTRSVPHPAQARRRRQLSLPIPVTRVPARPPRPVQTRLPVNAPRVPRTPPATTPPTPVRAPAPAGQSARTAVPRARQLALPIPAARVRVRPPRPVQLRLPLEPPTAPPASPRR
ncbi:conjugal transfer protein TrbL family protein [Streptomyces sp. HUAS MG91]|uniref:Conjugal transfer protein TrbL family protein n=1 Tax=Streptomyces tabacisoli TaxID=3156398 RepID=A0AAU8INQ3_9ACTN